MDTVHLRSLQALCKIEKNVFRKAARVFAKLEDSERVPFPYLVCMQAQAKVASRLRFANCFSGIIALQYRIEVFQLFFSDKNKDERVENYFDRIVRNDLPADPFAGIPGCSFAFCVICANLLIVFAHLPSNSEKVILPLRISIGSLSSMQRHLFWSLSRHVAAREKIMAVHFPASAQAFLLLRLRAHVFGFLAFLFRNMAGRAHDSFCNRIDFWLVRGCFAGTRILRILH
jgi:hypothetical protein